MSNIALYEIIDDGNTSYLYSHWGASPLTAGLRVDQAVKFQEFPEHRNEPLGCIMERLGYDGEYLHEGQTYLPNVNRIFELIEPSRARELVNSLHKGEHTVQAFVEINRRINYFRYVENPSLNGETYAFSGSLSKLRNEALRRYNESLHRTDRVQDFGDLSRELREDLISPPSGIHTIRSEALITGYDLSSDHKFTVTTIEMPVPCLLRRSISGADTIRSVLSEEYAPNISLVGYNGRIFGADALFERCQGTDPYAEIKSQSFGTRFLMDMPFEQENIRRLKSEIEQQLSEGALKKLMLLNIENSTPMLRVLPVRSGEDITDVVSQVLDRGNGVELRIIQGSTPDIVAFINQKDAGRRGNPVVLANGTDSGYFLSESQITRLQREFGQLTQQLTPQQRQQNSQEQGSGRRRR